MRAQGPGKLRTRAAPPPGRRRATGDGRPWVWLRLCFSPALGKWEPGSWLCTAGRGGPAPSSTATRPASARPQETSRASVRTRHPRLSTRWPPKPGSPRELLAPPPGEEPRAGGGRPGCCSSSARMEPTDRGRGRTCAPAALSGCLDGGRSSAPRLPGWPFPCFFPAQTGASVGGGTRGVCFALCLHQGVNKRLLSFVIPTWSAFLAYPALLLVPTPFSEHVLRVWGVSRELTPVCQGQRGERPPRHTPPCAVRHTAHSYHPVWPVPPRCALPVSSRSPPRGEG